MQKNNSIVQTFFELLEFQESWNLIGTQSMLGMPNKNQAEKLN